MNETKIKKLMEKDFEEITEEQFEALNGVGEISINTYLGQNRETTNLYFKPKVSFPLVYEDCMRKFEVSSDGSINIISGGDIIFGCDYIKVCDSLPLLYDAVAMSKKLRGKK